VELLLIAVVGGIAFWGLKPMRDWYVVELQCAAGGSRYVFKLTESSAAQLEFNRLVQKATASRLKATVCLWKVEARDRKAAMKLEPAGAGRPAPVLVKSQKIA
jgi:hypothetical protein